MDDGDWKITHGGFDLFRVRPADQHDWRKSACQGGLDHGSYEWLAVVIQELLGLSKAFEFTTGKDNSRHRLVNRVDLRLF